MSGVFYYQSMENPDHRGSGDAGTSENRSLGNSRIGNGRMSPNSPLKLFGQAKNNINEIFKDVQDFIKEADTFVTDIESNDYIENVPCLDKVKEYRARIFGIMEVLARDHMKVVFFGRTSNGKSTTINAMLREKILPTGIGHTTNCFLQVEGSDSEDGYLLTEEEPDQPKSVQSIKGLASALSNVKLKENTLLRILWPKNKCRLLKEDVVLVDSPGIDVSPDLDLWIDKFCLDADVFVLVSNAESTLMQTEKNFFHKVSARLSNPNIFILQNRWDISAFEEDVEQVKQQHLERNVQFLCDELKVMDRKEVLERVFFVSSREVLCARLKEQGTPTPSGMLQEGFQERLFAFSNFERVFEECISKSAVRTKFEQHTNRGKSIITDLRDLMETLYTQCVDQSKEMTVARHEMADKLDYLKKQLELLSNEIKDKIKGMVEDVERKVANTLNDEIRRLGTLVDEFEQQPFHVDQRSINIYKQELNEYLMKSLDRNVQSRCSSTVQNAVEMTKREMTDRMCSLLPDEARQQVQLVTHKHDFEIIYRLDCQTLCAGFQEDITFNFSLSPMNLFRKLMGINRSGFRREHHSFDSIPRPMSSDEPSIFVDGDSSMSMSVLALLATVGQRSAIGGLVVTGIVVKAVGWKIVAIGLSLYAGLYFYQRLSWTNKAKERCFKSQYVDYASSKLRLIVDLTSSNCSHQVQQELTSTFARLGDQADSAKGNLMDEIKQNDVKISQLENASLKAKTYRNKAVYLDKALDNFKERFLL